jgi:GTP cyclohydrolase IA
VSDANRCADTLPAVAGLAGDALEIEEAEEERWATVRQRHITAEQWELFEGYMREIFTALGMPATTPSTVDTPRRFLRALFDASSGYEGDEKLVTAFPTECHGAPDCRISQVVEGPIPFYSLCEHHSLPFYGHAYVGYIAHEHILGLSKLTRLVRLFARRFSVQNESASNLPSPWTAAWPRTALPCTWKRCICVRRCAACGSDSPAPAPRTGAGPTTPTRNCAPSFSRCVASKAEHTMTGSRLNAVLREPLTVLYDESGAPGHPLPAPPASGRCAAPLDARPTRSCSWSPRAGTCRSSTPH